MNRIVLVCYVFGQRPLVWEGHENFAFYDLNVDGRGALGLVSSRLLLSTKF